MYRQAPSFAYHDLGIVEDGDTASQAIEKDKFVIWKGASYFASTAIMQGETLEEDVNLTAIPDGVINGVVSALNNNFPFYLDGTQTWHELSYSRTGSNGLLFTTPADGLYGFECKSGGGSSLTACICLRSDCTDRIAGTQNASATVFSLYFKAGISVYARTDAASSVRALGYYA